MNKNKKKISAAYIRCSQKQRRNGGEDSVRDLREQQKILTKWFRKLGYKGKLVAFHDNWSSVSRS